MNFTEKLDRILPNVTNPGRYIGGEANQVRKNQETVLASMALVFPDVYEIGMSHNGTKVLYHLINREPDLAAERAFAPWIDMADQMKLHDIPLYTLESHRPVRSFSAIGISLQTELNFTNVPFLLELAGLNAFSRDRADSDPFVIGGGPCMANPEPVADFYDLFVIGDGEILAVQILRIIGEGRKNNLSKIEILKKLAELKGVYVPVLLEVTKNEKGEFVPDFDGAKGSYNYSKGIKRHWVEVLNKEDYPIKNVVPNMNLVHDRFSVEVMRGCTQGCRFCQAGYWYRPNRELKADDVIDLAKEGLAATGERTVGLLSLSTADYGQAEAVTNYLLQDDDFEGVDLSLPSLRANSYGQALAQKVGAMSNAHSATFAPETGSERIRKIINKTISDQDMYDAAEGVFKNGFHNIKLYTMVGLPSENMEDMKAFCGLIEGLVKIGRKYSPFNTVHPSIGIFVPKPVTPFQWVGFMEREKTMAHINYVREYFRGNRSVKISWSDWELAQVEAFYSRGDRSQSALIYEAYKRGMIFESFSEGFKYDQWVEIWNQFGYDINRVYETRELDEVFSWDFIHAGTSKSYLKAEYKKAFEESAEPIPDCKWGDCQKCGIPGNYEDIKLSPVPEKYHVKNLGFEDVKQLVADRKLKQYTIRHYQIIFKKTGLAKYLAHHVTIEIFEKALRRLKIRFHYTQGFNQRPIIKNVGALPLGMESHSEIFVIQLRDELPGSLQDWAKRFTEILPEGMEVTLIREMPNSKMPTIKSADYRLKDSVAGVDFSQIASQFELGMLNRTVINREKPIQLEDNIIKVWVDNGQLCLRVKANEAGATVSPYVLIAGLLDLPSEQIRLLPVSKEIVDMEDKKLVVSDKPSEAKVPN
ncbi:MAG: TIGR03960 family B12-binding radical SAM protein [Bacteroidetes bacterium]|nr:TIGR03960 family B12-binding radical SAM protein [Bacteroidota bacterium]